MRYQGHLPVPADPRIYVAQYACIWSPHGLSMEDPQGSSYLGGGGADHLHIKAIFLTVGATPLPSAEQISNRARNRARIECVLQIVQAQFLNGKKQMRPKTNPVRETPCPNLL